VDGLIKEGFTHVVDADLKSYRVQEKIFRPLFGFYDDLAQACAK
jgi:hypothetical protein